MKYKLFFVILGMFLTTGQLLADCIVTNNKFNKSSRIIYVNPYNGSDQLAKTYTLNNIRNPYQANNVAAFESIEKAKSLANASNGDLILIKTGRQWTNYQAWEDKKLSDFNKDVMKANSLTQGECQGESLTWVPSSVTETIPSGNPSATEYSSGNGSDSVTLARTQETESLRFPNTQMNDRFSSDRLAGTTSSSSASSNRFSRSSTGGGSSGQASSESTQSTRQNLIEKSSSRNFRSSVPEKLTLNDTDATTDNTQSHSVVETVTEVIGSIDYSQCEADAPWRAAIQTYPQDSNGWSIITPDTETRIVYVSSTDGNDSTAKTYLSAELDNPFNPKTIQPYKTIEKAYQQIRDGKPDWILFKKGDQFQLKNTIWLKAGKSLSAHMVIGAYGDISEVRPTIKSYDVTVFKGIKNKSYITIFGLDLYASSYDPNSLDFIGWSAARNGGSAIISTAGVSERYGNNVNGIYIENNRIRYYPLGIALGVIDGAVNQNVVIRRNEILNSYNINGHSQGIFLNGVSGSIIEENIFDHNGWYQQRPSNVAMNTKDYGYATFFNHNLYISDSSNLIIENNLSSRSSSIGIKFTSNSDTTTKVDTINSYNILLNKNIIIEGEVGLSIGGNKDFDNGYRWDNIQVINNVLTNIGRTQPTNRNIAFNIEASDWQSGMICGNTVSDNAARLSNTYGLQVIGHTRDTQVLNNNFINLGIDNDSSVLDSAENVTGGNNTYVSKVDNVNLLDMFVASQGFSDYESYINSVLNNLKNNPQSYYDVDTMINYINAKAINVKQTFELKE